LRGDGTLHSYKRLDTEMKPLKQRIDGPFHFCDICGEKEKFLPLDLDVDALTYMKMKHLRCTMGQLKRLDHGMLLNSKAVMDDAMVDLDAIRELIPEKLHDEFDLLVARFEDTLVSCDVADQYVEKT
jgi:hypothetical protein